MGMNIEQIRRYNYILNEMKSGNNIIYLLTDEDINHFQCDILLKSMDKFDADKYLLLKKGFQNFTMEQKRDICYRVYVRNEPIKYAYFFNALIVGNTKYEVPGYFKETPKFNLILT